MKTKEAKIKLVKAPNEGALRGQALEITRILKRGRGQLTRSALIAAIGKRISSKNVGGARDIWHMNRPKLIAGGYVEER
jgi:hypothetical protein